MNRKKNTQLLSIGQAVMRTKRKIAVFLILICLTIPIISYAQNLLDEPQKIVIDDEHNRLLVSNYGNGALVQIDDNDDQSYFVQDAGFIDGMDIYQKISVVKNIDIEKGILRRFTKNISSYNYISRNTNYESNKIIDLLKIAGVNPKHKIWSLGCYGRKIFSDA